MPWAGTADTMHHLIHCPFGRNRGLPGAHPLLRPGTDDIVDGRRFGIGLPHDYIETLTAFGRE
jgi:hypothetical protein